MAQSAVTHFTERRVEELSSRLREPDWLVEYRLDALRKFLSLPPEPSSLYSKYAGVSMFDPEQFSVADLDEKVDLRTHYQGYLTGKETNIVLQGNSTVLHVDLADDFARSGVEVMSLQDAVSKHGKLLQDLFSRRIVDYTREKYAAFNAAFFTSGTFVRVPRNSVPPSALRKILLIRDPRAGVVERTIVYAEEGSKLDYVEELYTGSSKGQYLASTALEVFAGDGAKVHVSSLQSLDENAIYLSNATTSAANDAKVTFAAILLGARIIRVRLDLRLDGRGSSIDGYQVFFCDGKQRCDVESNLLHNSPHSTASLSARAVLKDEAQSIFKGMIKISQVAKNSSSYLSFHGMLLDPRARSDDIPSLDIQTNEVKATHSASVAQIDEDQIFYLMARGLPRDEARKLIVIGFFEPVLSRIPVEIAREGAKFIVEGKWNGERRRLVDRETLMALTGEVPIEAKQGGDIFERHYKYSRS